MAVCLKKGACLLVPKGYRFDRLVAGQIPLGWDARKYGIPDDIVAQVNPVTLWVLVCTVESPLASGITDPYEFYKYVHISEVGNCIGSGVGGATAPRGMFRDRYLDQPIQKNILQESFINNMSAWVNMLILSSAGPIKTRPVPAPRPSSRWILVTRPLSKARPASPLSEASVTSPRKAHTSLPT